MAVGSPYSASRQKLGSFHRFNEWCETLPSRPVFLVLFLLLANFIGFYCPVFWSDSDRPPLLRLQNNWPGEKRFRQGGLRENPWKDSGSEERRYRDGEGGLTPYVSHVDITVQAEPICQGIIPPRLFFADNQQPISSVRDLPGDRRRVLLFMPRHGLGNSLRGFVSAFVYARVSGRRLIRLHAAEHNKVYDTLCTAFSCGFDAIVSDNETNPMTLYKQVEAVGPVQMQSAFKTSYKIRSSLGFSGPIILSKSPAFFDGFWQNYPRVKACVYAAFHCSSLWCVHSRAIHELMGGPTPLLQRVIGSVLMRHVGDGKPDKPSSKGVIDMFDVALHVRTRPAAIESLKGQVGESVRVGCQDGPFSPGEGGRAARKGRHLLAEGEGGVGGGVGEGSGAVALDGRPHEFLKDCLWNCIAHLLERIAINQVSDKPVDPTKVPPSGKKRRLSVLLTTDNEYLRPAFVQRLAAVGARVYYSTGSIVHLSKSASDDSMDRMPTMAEFFLMAKSHHILEAGSYVSTFAQFAGLFGNGTLAGIDWFAPGNCGFKIVHQGEALHRPTGQSEAEEDE